MTARAGAVSKAKRRERRWHSIEGGALAGVAGVIEGGGLASVEGTQGAALAGGGARAVRRRRCERPDPAARSGALTRTPKARGGGR